MQSYKYGDIMGIRNTMISLIAIFVVILGLGVYYDKISTELGILTSVITFIYGFFFNSLFNFIQKKYNDFATSLADLSASIQSLYNLAILTRQTRFIKETRSDLIKLVVSLKRLSPHSYYETQGIMDHLYKNLDDYKIKNKKQEVILSRMINIMRDLSINRERVELYGVNYLVGETKILFYTLTILVMFSILSISIKLHLFLIFGIVLIFSLVFISVFIYKLDRNRYGKDRIRSKNLDALLESLK